jgi:microcystin-dependent protein
LAQRGGTQDVTLTEGQLPSHTHALNAVDLSPADFQPDGDLPTGTFNLYAAPNNFKEMATSSIGSSGGGQEHFNMQPFTVLNFCICTAGLHPPRP